MKLVCTNCFSDEELTAFINSQGNIGDCSYCEKKQVTVLRLSELLDFFKELLDNFQKKDDGNELLSIIQQNWNLFSTIDIGHLILNDALNALKHSFQNSNEFVNFSEDILENIGYWSILKEQLKWENRYITDIGKLIHDLGWDGFFDSTVVIKNEDVFYRARLHKNKDEKAYPPEEMGAPPKDYTSSGRANSLGIPFLYLSDNDKTILYEVRASYLDEVSIAKFVKNDTLEKDILISDFTKTPTLYHPNEVNRKIKSTLLKKEISRDLSKPMRRYDSELEYIPTQFICEFIKIFTNVQGIKFRSSLHESGNNLVIFNQNIMKCIDVKKVSITKVEVDSVDLV